MQISKLTKIFGISLVFIWLAGCAGQGTQETSSEVAEQQGESKTDSAVGGDGTGVDVGGQISGQDVNIPVPNVTTFYFDFDRAIVKAEARAGLDKVAYYLVNNSSAKVVLEGHCDERGTVEYNLALGERRAKAVRRYLLVQGVAAGQMETISFGEEKPASLGNNELSWSKNRRVQVVFQTP